MNRTRTSLAAVTASIVLILGLSACGGSDDPGSKAAKEPAPAATTPTPTVDPIAADQAAVTDLIQRYWAAIVVSENTASTDPAPFAGLADPKIIEDHLATVATYQDFELLRVGEPAITDIDVTVTGDKAAIVLCLDEDNWRAEVKGKPRDGDKKFGNAPWAARAERVDGAWIVTKIVMKDMGGKLCEP